jgi:hypothetical protein
MVAKAEDRGPLTAETFEEIIRRGAAHWDGPQVPDMTGYFGAAGALRFVADHLVEDIYAAYLRGDEEARAAVLSGLATLAFFAESAAEQLGLCEPRDGSREG